jgi:hypothetical protein
MHVINTVESHGTVGTVELQHTMQYNAVETRNAVDNIV